MRYGTSLVLMQNIGPERGFQPSSGRGIGGLDCAEFGPTALRAASRSVAHSSAGRESPIHRVENSPVAGSALDGFAVFGPPPRNHGFGESRSRARGRFVSRAAASNRARHRMRQRSCPFNCAHRAGRRRSRQWPGAPPEGWQQQAGRTVQARGKVLVVIAHRLGLNRRHDGNRAHRVLRRHNHPPPRR